MSYIAYKLTDADIFALRRQGFKVSKPAPTTEQALARHEYQKTKERKSLRQTGNTPPPSALDPQDPNP